MEKTEEARMEEMMEMLRFYEKARSEGVAPENLELEALLSAMKQGEDRKTDATNIKLPGADEREEAEREEILPKPFFVVKSINDKKQKVFINMCGSEKIPGPANWEAGVPPDVEEALASMEADDASAVQNVRLPLSCSEPTLSSDHCGKPSLVYDVVYNTSIVEAAMVDKRLKVFMIDTALTWISQKFSTQLSSDFKLPNIKYKGDVVRTQCIRKAPRGPLINEVPDVESELHPAFPLFANKEQMAATLKHKYNELPLVETNNQPKLKHPVETTVESKPTSQRQTNEVRGENKDSTVQLDIKTPADEHLVKVKENKDASSDSMTSDESLPPAESVIDEKPKLPVVQTEYLGRPVQLIFLHISFPSEVSLDNVTVCSTNTEVYVESTEFEALEVPLLFPVSPENGQAELSRENGVITVKLPYLGYKGLYCCGNTKDGRL